MEEPSSHVDQHGKQLEPDHSVSLRSEPEGREAAISVLREQVNSAYEQEPPNQLAGESTPNTYNWQQYHNAWQQYYQQYYHRYYLWQLRNQQQLADKATAAAILKPAQETDIPRQITDNAAEQKADVEALQKQLLHKIRARASKFRHGYYFVPLVSALVVGSCFLFLQYNALILANVQAFISPGSTVNVADIVLVDPATNLSVGPEPRLIIPKIDVDTQVFYDITTLDTGPIEAALNNGIVHYNLPGANSLPGQIGNAVFLGHSSNDIFNPGSSKFVFVLLDRLEPGDLFYVNYQGTRYIYRVSNKQVIKPTDVAALQIATDKPLATLVTCTPIGTDLNRLIVTGEQIAPDPNLAAKPASASGSTANVNMPGIQPTVIDKILNAF